jgi:Zn finger protein HypA/HybF involved in hydrogenase expression
MNQVYFKCRCGFQWGWVAEGQITTACPNCGRKYIGICNKKHHRIDAIIFRGKPNKEQENGNTK